MSTPALIQQAPYSQEAEEAVLGAVMINPESFLAVASFLNADDFFILRHGYIWEAMTRIVERNDRLDTLTVQEELRAHGRLNDIGGPAYLMQLINNTPTSVHAEIYGRLVERAALRRRLLTAADEIKSLAMDETLTTENVTSESESRLFRVTERNLRRDIVPMREAVIEYYDKIEHLMQHQDEPLGLPTGFRDMDELLGGLQRSDLLVFAGRPGMGKCVSAGTLIPTGEGLKPIEDLKPTDVDGIEDDEGGVYYPFEIGVQTPNGLKQTAYFYDSGVKPTLRIQTRAGYALSGTHVHPVLTLSKSGEKVWKPLCAVVPGDFVAVQRHETVWGNSTQLPAFEYKYNENLRSTKVPKLPFDLTVELAYFLGLLAGDGNLTREDAVSISSADPEILEIFYRWADSMGLSARHNANYDHRISSKVLTAWLKHLGLWGYAYEKEIPAIILQSGREHVQAFLQGLFDTDGHPELQNGYIQFVTTCEKLARQVHIILLQFGIVSKLTFKRNAYRGAWCIRITGDAARNFYDRVGFRLKRKQQRRELLPENANSNLDVIPYLPQRISSLPKRPNYHRYFNGKRSPSYTVLQNIAVYAPEVSDLLEPEFYWDEITNVEDSGLQHCYDLTVPDGHTFVSNGIVSHNTSFLLSVALNAAKLGARIAIFTMEMGADQIVQRFVSMETGINTQKLRLGQLTPQEWQRFVQASGRLGNLRIFIDDSPSMTPLQMRTKCRRMSHEFGLDLVILDYIQLMNAGSGYENNRVQEISYISRNLKELARELNVPLFSAAQLSRAVEQRQDKRPQLSDLRESGAIEQDADIVIFLYRDVVYNEATEFPNRADLIVAKHRNGPTGTVSLHFEKSLTKFADARTSTIDLSNL
jgi:replicative DNA helicase